MHHPICKERTAFVPDRTLDARARSNQLPELKHPESVRAEVLLPPHRGASLVVCRSSSSFCESPASSRAQASPSPHLPSRGRSSVVYPVLPTPFIDHEHNTLMPDASLVRVGSAEIVGGNRRATTASPEPPCVMSMRRMQGMAYDEALNWLLVARQTLEHAVTIATRTGPCGGHSTHKRAVARVLAKQGGADSGEGREAEAQMWLRRPFAGQEFFIPMSALQRLEN
ncbi:hypothetical protein EYR36_010035 [Pleurotus pulmonarius]|nr:hypothetical protein EYR36_010035 [Pleurotus pulmonarius]